MMPVNADPALKSAPPVPDNPSSPSEARRYWADNLDPRNLERVGESDLGIEDEIAFAETPDLAAAAAWLAGGGGEDARERVIIDLGAGLGANAFALARRGFAVIAVDTSIGRLRELRRRAVLAGCGDRIRTVAGAAEALPFRDGALDGIYTKSVLIHADRPAAAREIARVLRSGGRAALVEPQPGNPFAWLYRRTLAPRAWRTITHYFDRADQRLFINAAGSGGVRHFYILSFLAFAFQFAAPNRRLFTLSLRLLNALDRSLLGLCPWLHPLAWFGVIEAGKGIPPEPDANPGSGR